MLMPSDLLCGGTSDRKYEDAAYLACRLQGVLKEKIVTVINVVRKLLFLHKT